MSCHELLCDLNFFFWERRDFSKAYVVEKLVKCYVTFKRFVKPAENSQRRFCRCLKDYSTPERPCVLVTYLSSWFTPWIHNSSPEKCSFLMIKILFLYFLFCRSFCNLIDSCQKAVRCAEREASLTNDRNAWHVNIVLSVFFWWIARSKKENYENTNRCELWNEKEKIKENWNWINERSLLQIWVGLAKLPEHPKNIMKLRLISQREESNQNLICLRTM